MENPGGTPRVWYARVLRELFKMLSNAGSVQYAVPMPPEESAEPAPAEPRSVPVREPVPVA